MVRAGCGCGAPQTRARVEQVRQARRQPRVRAQHAALQRHARHRPDAAVQVAVHYGAQLALPQLADSYNN